MNEYRERRVSTRIRHEQIQRLPRRIAEGQPKVGAAALERVDAIKLTVPHPVREYFLVLRHPGAVVIFCFVIDSGHARLPAGIDRHCGMPDTLASFRRISTLHCPPESDR